MILLLSVLAFAEPAEDIAPPCDFALVDVVPPPGSTAVPLDTVIRVQGTGFQCDPAPITLELVAADGPVELFDAPTADRQWSLYDTVELRADTDYDATFSHPEVEDVLVSFTTSAEVAAPPEPPVLTIDRVEALEVQTDRAVHYVLTARVQAILSDTSGASTAIFSTLGVERVERGGAGGVIQATITWTQTDAVEGCVSAQTVSGSLEVSTATEACRAVDELLVEPGGCACSTSTTPSVAWLALLGIPPLARRRRR